MPQAGESLVWQDKVRIQVLEATSRRIDRVRIERLPKERPARKRVKLPAVGLLALAAHLPLPAGCRLSYSLRDFGSRSAHIAVRPLGVQAASSTLVGLPCRLALPQLACAPLRLPCSWPWRGCASLEPQRPPPGDVPSFARRTRPGRHAGLVEETQEGA